MLKLILGRAGTGKTYQIYDQLYSCLKNTDDNCILLVPEQITFETEKFLIDKMGEKYANSVKAYSFTRLAMEILSESNINLDNLMDDGIRALVLSEALDATADRRNATNNKFHERRDVGKMQTYLSMITELKQNNISYNVIHDSISNIKHEMLQNKMNDLAIIMQAYDSLITGHYIDSDVLFDKAIEFAPQVSFLQNCHIFIDGFTGFTEQELKLLKCLLLLCNITASFCVDHLNSTSDIDAFTISRDSANNLIKIAKELHITVDEPQYLYENHRYKSADMEAVERSLFNYDIEKEETNESVSIIECFDAYNECKMVANKIKKHLRNGGRFKDVAIVCRSTDEYAGIIRTIFEQEDIPYYMDYKDNILTDPIVEEIISALHVILNGWKFESVLRLMKTGMLGFSKKSISLIENYSFMWEISGNDWKKEWTQNVNGFAENKSEKDARQLYVLNIIRSRLVKPLIELEKKLNGKITGKDFAIAIYEYLQDTCTPRMLKMRVSQLEKIGESVLADRTERVWDVVMHILDLFANTTNSEHSADRYLDLFHLVCSFTNMGTVPQKMDSIQIGAADRMRFAAPKIVFMLGVNEGVFPAVSSFSGYLNDRERQKLIDIGLHLQKSIEYSLAEERYFAYAAVTAPSEKLYVSYQLSSSGSEKRNPSEVVKSIKRILPNLVVEKFNVHSEEDIEYFSEALDYFAKNIDSKDDLKNTIYQAFQHNQTFKDMADKVINFTNERNLKIEDNTISDGLFTNRNVSPSSIEEYFKCPFLYFCDYGLRLNKKEKAELKPSIFGTVVHYILETLIPRYKKIGFHSISFEKIQKDAKLVVDEYVERFMGGINGKPSRFMYLLTRLEKLCVETLWFIVQEMQQSLFEPVDYELNIDYKGDIDPLLVELPDGTFAKIRGKVDRVDLLQKNGKNYIRIIDYKTGKKEFLLDQVVEGINLQMLLYLFAICKNGKERYGDVDPAGVIYLPTKLMVIKDNALKADDTTLSRFKNIETSGILIDDPEILEAMDHNDKKVFIPSNNFASLQQFGVLSEKINSLVVKMVQSLQNGEVNANPYVYNDNYDNVSCTYCNYQSICRLELSNINCRKIDKKSNATVFEELMNEFKKINE